MPQNPTLPHTLETERLLLTWPRETYRHQITAFYRKNYARAEAVGIHPVSSDGIFASHPRVLAAERREGRAWQLYLISFPKTSPTIIGTIRCDELCRLDTEGTRTGVLHVLLDRQYENQGYTREALEAMKSFLKEANIRLVNPARPSYDETKTFLGDREFLKKEGLYEVLADLTGVSISQKGF
jgi:RimJ/RimL family protein N-acetyltransferase